MTICKATGEHIRKFEEIIKDNGAALKAVSWSFNSFSGDANRRVNDAIKKVGVLRSIKVSTKSEADNLLKNMSNIGLIEPIKTSAGIHYKTDYAELIDYIISNKRGLIKSATGNISEDTWSGDYDYVFSTKPIERDELHMAAFDQSVKDINKVGEGMLGVSLMSLDGIVSTERVNETVDTIVERIAREVISSESGSISKSTVESIIGGYRNGFIKLYHGFANNNNQKGVEHVESYLKNWNNLESMVFNKLKSRSGIQFKEGVSEKDLKSQTIQDEDTIKENNQDVDLDGPDRAQGFYSDDYSITLDSKNGLSAKLKLFMSTLKNGKQHYMTKQDLYENFDTVYNTLNPILANEEPNINQMLNKLEYYKDIYPWAKDLISKLRECLKPDSNNLQLAKEFVVAMNKHRINMSFVNYKTTPNGFEFKVMSDNSNEMKRVVLNDWSNRLYSSDFIITKDEDFTKMFNPESAIIPIKEFDELFVNKNKSTASEIKDTLGLVGVDITDKTAESLLKNGLYYNGKQYNINQLLSKTETNSPFANIYKKLVAIKNSDGKFEVGESKDYDWFSDGSVGALAELESKYTKHLYSNSYNSGNKTIFAFTNDKFIVDRMRDLTKGFITGIPADFELLDQLETDVFAKDSYWLKQLRMGIGNNDINKTAFSNKFEFGYLSLDPLKEQKGESTDRSLADLTDKEILAIKLALMHNNTEKFNGRRVGKLFYPTMSDKTTMLTIQSLIRDDIMYDHYGHIMNEKAVKSIDNNTVDFIFNNIVKAEMNRMWQVQKATKNYSEKLNIEGYNDGARWFYTIPELNGLKSIFTEDVQTGIRILRPELEDIINNNIDSDMVSDIKEKIRLSMNFMIANQIEQFKKEGIGFVEGEKHLQYIDSKTVSETKSKYNKPSDKDVSDAIAADFAVNYFINNCNVAQLFHGDYAQYFKSKGAKDQISRLESDIKSGDVVDLNTLYSIVKPTFDNLGKRLAADLAPGYEADFGEKTHMRVVVSTDREMPSKSIDFIKKVYNDGDPNQTQAEKDAIKSWSSTNTSDAQSWSSLDFHIDTLFNFGNKNISEKDYKHLKKKIADARAKNEDVDFTKDELTLVLQPTKPLYSNNRQVNINGVTVGLRSYIKTSSFPLIPQLVKDTELEPIMRSMESGKSKVDMIVFESGFKVGAVDSKLSLFDEKTGLANIDNINSISDESNHIVLPIKGYKIQQEVPYHDHPGDVNKGTQESKLLFSNIKHITGFEYGVDENDKPIKHTGEELEKIYNDKYRQLYEQEAEKLRKEILIEGTNRLNFEKLQKILAEEANNRNYSINDKIGLSLNEKKDAFNFPLWTLPAAHQYESMIIAVVDNRVRKLKIPGNSFVLGSEAGFKYKKIETFEDEGLKTIKKYQDSIIFTSKFNGESLLSYREDGDKMKPTQVFVPNKLQGKNGEFIDLMKYTKTVNGRLYIDEDRFPTDLMNMFGFRIPTQGHNSMTSIEIAGFLPAECGDLIIASQDLVTQMGSDFDVDKLYTYMYLTREVFIDEDAQKQAKEKLKAFYTKESKEARGQFKEILDYIRNHELDDDTLEDLQQRLDDIKSDNKEIKELKEFLRSNTKIVKDDKKSLYNDILDIHLAVFKNNNKELYKLILSPNGFGELKRPDGSGLAKDIEAIKEKAGTNRFNYLSPQYQQSKFMNGVAGKMGVGVFSSTSMLHAICQGKQLRYVDSYVSIDGELRDNFSVKFGDVESTGEIGRAKTIDEKYYVSKIIEAFQSASVDNEKEQILYKLNINKHTATVINALSLLGFNEDVICYFINQPIIEEYVRKASEKDSSLKKFDVKLSKDVFKALSDEIKEKYKIDKKDDSFDNAGVELLKEQMSLNLTQREAISQSFWAKQLSVLEKFQYLNDVGLDLQALMQTVNAESKGLGKSGFGSLERADKVLNIDSTTEKYGVKSVSGILNAGRLLFDYDQNGNVIYDEFGGKKAATMNGYVHKNGTELLNNIISQVFPYDNKELRAIFDYAKNLLDKKSASINQNEEFLMKLFQSMKSYLFSNTKLFGEDFDISKERKRLFVGEYEKIQGVIYEEYILKDPSLPDIVNALKSEPIGKSNLLLQQLVPDLRMKSSEAKLIRYTASTGQNLDESELHQAFIALFRENVPLKYTIGKKERTIQSKDLALDLIKYAYLSGGSQEAIQFTRYIPIEVLSYIGFNDEIKNMSETFGHRLFGTTFDENGSVNGSAVLEQILQHNPSMIPVKLDTKKPNDIKDVEKDGDVIIKFKPNFDIKANIKDGEYLVGQQYVSAKFGQKWYIYKSNGGEFELIPTLGTFGMSEYNFNLPKGEIAKSIFDKRNINAPTTVTEKYGQPVKEDASDARKIYDLYKNSLDNKGNQIEGVLKLISKNGNPENKIIADELLSNPNILQSLSKINVSYESIPSLGVYIHSKNALKINNSNEKLKDKSLLEGTLLHEIIHGYTSRQLRLIYDEDFRGKNIEEFENLPSNVVLASKRIDAIRRSLIYKVKQLVPDFQKSLDKVKAYTVEPGSIELSGEKDQLAYALSNNMEFVSMALTNEFFRQKIDSLSNQDAKSGSMLEKLWNALLEFLGLNNLSKINKDYITQEIFQFINVIEKPLEIKEEFKLKTFDLKEYKEVEVFLNKIENEDVADNVGYKNKINIYAGTNENADLSNFAIRPFTYNGFNYNSVEQAFQHQKLITSAPHSGAMNYLNDDVNNKILKSKTGAEAKQLGRQIKNLNIVAWDRISSQVMKELLVESFKQNPKALEGLLSTGNAELTHIQDKSKWGMEFPRLLMEVRAELSRTPEGQDVVKKIQNKNIVLKPFDLSLINTDNERKVFDVYDENNNKTTVSFWSGEKIKGVVLNVVKLGDKKVKNLTNEQVIGIFSELKQIGDTESLAQPEFIEPSLDLTDEEKQLLIKRHGENAVNEFNQLSDEEKEIVIKCLR